MSIGPKCTYKRIKLESYYCYKESKANRRPQTIFCWTEDKRKSLIEKFIPMSTRILTPVTVNISGSSIVVGVVGGGLTKKAKKNIRIT